jgi:hypothetical protein
VLDGRGEENRDALRNVLFSPAAKVTVMLVALKIIIGYILCIL